MNNVVLTGRLCQDPVLRDAAGVPVASFTLAVDRHQKEKKTDFVPIKVWGKSANTAADYLSKGRMIGVEGSLQVYEYENKEGEKRRGFEVSCNRFEFLERKDAAPAPVEQAAAQPQNEDMALPF